MLHQTITTHEPALIRCACCLEEQDAEQFDTAGEFTDGRVKAAAKMCGGPVCFSCLEGMAQCAECAEFIKPGGQHFAEDGETYCDEGCAYDAAESVADWEAEKAFLRMAMR